MTVIAALQSRLAPALAGAAAISGQPPTVIDVIAEKPLFDDSFESCQDNSGCATTEYCKKTAPQAPGACAVKPTDCFLIFLPACGFDNNTYGNACKAAAAGVNVLRAGSC